MYIPHSYIINNICKLNISQQKRILGLLWIKSIFQDKFLYIIYRYSVLKIQKASKKARNMHNLRLTLSHFPYLFSVYPFILF